MICMLLEIACLLVPGFLFGKVALALSQDFALTETDSYHSNLFSHHFGKAAGYDTVDNIISFICNTSLN